MQNTTRDLERLQSEFQACRKLLTALGDETRQYLLYTMLSGPCGGSRVVEIAQRTNLSRASISHHIQIFEGCRNCPGQEGGHPDLLLSGAPGPLHSAHDRSVFRHSAVDGTGPGPE